MTNTPTPRLDRETLLETAALVLLERDYSLIGAGKSDAFNFGVERAHDVLLALAAYQPEVQQSSNCAIRCFVVAEEERCIDCPSRLPQASQPESSREAALEKELDEITHALGLPQDARKIAGCNVLAHYATDLATNYSRMEGALRDLITLCKGRGMEVTAFACALKSNAGGQESRDGPSKSSATPASADLSCPPAPDAAPPK